MRFNVYFLILNIITDYYWLRVTVIYVQKKEHLTFSIIHVLFLFLVFYNFVALFEISTRIVPVHIPLWEWELPDSYCNAYSSGNYWLLGPSKNVYICVIRDHFFQVISIVALIFCWIMAAVLLCGAVSVSDFCQMPLKILYLNSGQNETVCTVAI